MGKIKITKNENWFKHDFRAREDKKLLKLKMKYKSSAPIGVFWQLVEMIYENEGEMELDIELLAFQLSESEDMIKDIIEQCFILSDYGLTHETIIEQLELRKEKYELKSQKGKEAADKRWGNDTTPIGNLSTTYTKVMGSDTRERVESRETELEKELRDDSKNKTKININIVNKLLDELFIADGKDTIMNVLNDMKDIGLGNICSALNYDKRQRENLENIIEQKLNSITD